MKRLTNLEYRRLLECIAELYEHDDLHRLKPRLSAIVNKIVPAILTFLNTFNLQRQDLPAIFPTWPENSDPNFEPEIARLIYQEHPCIHHIAQNEVPGAVENHGLYVLQAVSSEPALRRGSASIWGRI